MSVVSLTTSSSGENTIVNIQDVAEQIHASNEFLREFHSKVQERFGNAVIDVGIFKGVLDNQGLTDVLNTMLQAHVSDDSEKFIIVAVAGVNIPKPKKPKDISHHISLMNNVADTLHSLYNKRLSITENKIFEEYSSSIPLLNDLDVLIQKGWRLKTLDTIDLSDPPDKQILPNKLKMLERRYKSTLRKFNVWNSKVEEFLKTA